MTAAVDGTLRTEENPMTPKPVRVLDRAPKRVRHALIGGAVAMLTVSVASALVGPAAGAALPFCGGNQTAHSAPRTCTTTKLIDGTRFTVVLDVTAAGVATVTYTMDEPRLGETPIRVRWHEGINSGPSAAEVSGVIPRGSTGPVTLSLTAPNCGGQIDMKAVFTTNGDSRGRVGGPLISIETCATAATTTSTSTPPTTIATTTPTTVLQSSTATAATVASTSGASVLAATVTAHPAGGLPVTGDSGMSLAAAGVVALMIGAVLVLVTRRRLPFSNSE
jgi:LPXTG-motif cell wall-anchored protein